MKLVNNNIETLPIDMILVLLKLLIVESFQDFYNFFIAWARTQRTSAIVILLESMPLRDLYKFRIGSPSDVTCFDRFFRISEQLRINDGIFYARCRHIVTGGGNIENHLTILDDLASTGQLLYMVGKFIFKNLYKTRDTSRCMLEDVAAIRSLPYYRMNIVPALAQIRNIKESVEIRNNLPEICIVALCPNHSIGLELSGHDLSGLTEECLFCNIAALLNVITKNAM